MESNETALGAAFDHDAIAREVESRFGEFFRSRVNPTAAQRDRDYATFAPELLAEMAALGLVGFTAPREIGGGGRTWEEWGHALEEIGYRCEDTGLPMLLSYRETATNLMYTSGMRGRPHLIERYAEPAVRGRHFIGWLYTEETDAFDFTTRVARRDGAWVLDGMKKASTGAPTCTCWIVYARIEDSDDTMVVLVEAADPGVTTLPQRSLGMRSLGVSSVRFDNVVLGDDRIIQATDGLSHSQLFVNERRVTGSSWLLGRMRALIQHIIDDTLPKSRFGRRLVEFDTFIAAIGRMQAALESARALLYRVLHRVEQGKHRSSYLHDPLVAVSKYVATEAAVLCADTAQRLAGDHGFFERFEIDRYLRDFYSIVPIIGGQYAIETELGRRVLFFHKGRGDASEPRPLHRPESDA